MEELFRLALDLFIHLDKHLAEAVQHYGLWTYALLTLIIFCETGLVFTPFLPGDSLLFAAGALTVTTELNIFVLFALLTVAAIIGDSLNYWVGKRFGEFLIRRHSRWLKPEHLDKTHAFFEKYGPKTIVIARFVPIVRTFAPFVAGMGAMSYGRFFYYNVFGGVLWVGLCLAAGYFFGNLPIVKENFSLVVLAIVVISILPAIWGFVSARASSNAARPNAAEAKSAIDEQGSVTADKAQ